MERKIYPTNYNFWDEDRHYEATLDNLQPWNPFQPVTVIGNEEVICVHQGYNIPDGFMLVRLANGTISSVHRSRLT